MNIATASLSRQGTRASNQDQTGETIGERSACFVVCDGIAGLPGGEVAAELARNSIISRFDGDKHLNAQHIRDYVQTANRTILSEQQAVQDYRRMGTTLVMGVFQGARVMIGHVGDSRCYRLRGGTLQQITRDHSLLQEQIDAGLISVEQAQFATHKNLVTRALGVEDTVLLEVNEFRVEDGDIYLFCSDGLSDMVPDERIAEILLEEAGLEASGRSLVDCANGNGGRDNISVILAQARAKPVKRGLLSRMLGQP